MSLKLGEDGKAAYNRARGRPGDAPLEEGVASDAEPHARDVAFDLEIPDENAAKEPQDRA
jgi:hypothetical protein